MAQDVFINFALDGGSYSDPTKKRHQQIAGALGAGDAGFQLRPSENHRSEHARFPSWPLSAREGLRAV